MELGVRDWMIIVGVLLIVAVLLDGYRRVRNERRGNIRISLNKNYLNASDDADDYQSSELPNGGARVVGRSGGDAGGPRREPQLGELDDLELDQSVPMLMESVISANMAGELAEDEPEHRDLFNAGAEDAPEAADETAEPHAAEPAPAREPPPERRPAEAGAGENFGRAEEIVIINVIARDKPFKGADLLHILLACDLRFGKMNIFHRHEQANGRGQVQFSVANSVEPGTFNLDAIDDFSTPGVCFFMSVPGPEDPITAFECMVETAHCLVKNLDGEMRDESRSVMTMQTLEHCRQRLQEFERRQLAQA